MPPLNPLLETDKIECIHKGKVILQSSTKDLMCVQDSNSTDAGAISLQDLANAVIIGCTNNIAGIPNPCTKLVSIPNSITSSLLEIDNQKIVLAQTISQVITDKGSPLILQGEPKAKDILELDEDIVEFNNAQNTNDSEKSISESKVVSNADSSESNAKSSNESSSKSSKNSNKDSQAQKEQMVLEVVRKWEYKTKQTNGSYIYDSAKPTVSEFVLKKDDKQILKGYILEPEGPDTTESKKNKRIPIGEYNVKWHKSPFAQNKNKELTARRLDIPNKQTNDKFSHITTMLDQMTKCNNAKCKYRSKTHSHIVPLLYNEKVSDLRGILIHLGSKRENSSGCLLPGFELNNKNNPTGFVAGSTTKATAELLARIMEHDLDSYNKLATVPNFKVIISNDYSSNKE